MTINRMVALLFFMAVVVAAMLPSSAMSERVNVGGAIGWTTWENKVNYTEWSSRQKVYVGDWLFFKYDKLKYNVLEVNKTSYEECNDQGFLKNITRGGRDVYQVMEARPYYFLSGGGYCNQGLKVAIDVYEAPPTPAPTLAMAAKTTKSGDAATAQPLLWAVAAVSAMILLAGF